MKSVSEAEMERLGPEMLASGHKFAFRCDRKLGCFNRCCHNLKLLLYPYDVLRLKKNLSISADDLIEKYVDIVLRDGQHFPEVLLRMAEGPQRSCIFLKAAGCAVYTDRPHTCRLFPVEQGIYFDAAAGRTSPVFFFRPPDFCLGPAQDQRHTIDGYIRDQHAALYDEMTTRWAEIRRLMESDPWGAEGPQGARARMAFMASYNMDRFRQFVFQSSFLSRYRVPAGLLARIRSSETELLRLGFEWIKWYLWGISSDLLKPS